MNRLIATSLACVALAACAGAPADSPSLALRPAERQPSLPDIPVRENTASPAISPAMRDELARQRRAAEQADERFAQRLAGARRLVADAGSPGGDGWAVAQLAIAELIAERSATIAILSDLDWLYIAALDREAEQGSAGSSAAIGAVQGEVAALVARQDSALSVLLSAAE